MVKSYKGIEVGLDDPKECKVLVARWKTSYYCQAKEKYETNKFSIAVMPLYVVEE